MKKTYWDIIVIITLAVVLSILSETDTMWILFKLPFVTIFAAYVIGRVIGGLKVK